MIKSPWPQSEMYNFLEDYFYSPEAFLIGEIHNADSHAGEIFASCPAHNSWLVSPHQRGRKEWHPRHISGSDLIMLTASLGSLHAYFFHGCTWKEGWVGFGNRIEKAVFHQLCRPDLPLEIFSKELRVRRGNKRTMINFEFNFSQNGKLTYSSNQTALFIKSDLTNK